MTALACPLCGDAAASPSRARSAACYSHGVCQVSISSFQRVSPDDVQRPLEGRVDAGATQKRHRHAQHDRRQDARRVQHLLRLRRQHNSCAASTSGPELSSGLSNPAPPSPGCPAHAAPPPPASSILKLKNMGPEVLKNRFCCCPPMGNCVEPQRRRSPGSPRVLHLLRLHCQYNSCAAPTNGTVAATAPGTAQIPGSFC